MRIVVIVYFICALEYRYVVLSRGLQHQRGLTIPKVLIAVPREFSLRERELKLQKPEWDRSGQGKPLTPLIQTDRSEGSV